MSEEGMAADSLLRENAALRRRLDSALHAGDLLPAELAVARAVVALVRAQWLDLPALNELLARYDRVTAQRGNPPAESRET